MTGMLEPANYKGRESYYWLEQLEAHVDEGGQIGERAARDLLAEVKRFRAEKEGYRCFHCKMIFTDEAAARDHFGAEITDTPKCLDAEALLAALKKVQRMADGFVNGSKILAVVDDLVAKAEARS